METTGYQKQMTAREVRKAITAKYPDYPHKFRVHTETSPFTGNQLMFITVKIPEGIAVVSEVKSWEPGTNHYSSDKGGFAGDLAKLKEFGHVCTE